MKNIFLKLASFFLLVVLSFSSCMEEKFEDAQEGYDFNAIVPKVLGINAPKDIVQSLESTLSVTYHRGGSTWAWTATGATIKSVSADTRSAVILFNQAPADLKAKITVVETTLGGKVSEPKTVEVIIKPFCPLNINNFLGNSVCTEEGYGDYPAGFTLAAGQTKRIVNDNFWDYPAPGATIYYDLSGDINQTVTVPKQDFTFGDGEVGWVQGSGVYDGCAKTMNVTYSVFYAGDTYTTKHVFKF